MERQDVKFTTLWRGQRHGMEIGSGIRCTMPDPDPRKSERPRRSHRSLDADRVPPDPFIFNSPNRRR